MAESVKGLRRTCYCGELRTEHIGEKVTLFGWVQRRRNLGSLIFIDLRDREGICQLTLDENTSEKELFEKAASVHSEYVLAVCGTVRERSAKNKDIPTGDVEVEVSELRILSESETPPFEIAENSKTAELTRLKYRYLDLRRPDLQRNIILRHKITKLTRDYFDENGFIELETPILVKSTPEGARDFLVPSRLHKGEFYALPQSPQLYKQLSMVAGFDRYMQIARCFRDEDLRADRQPEFTQIDIEMSFVDQEDVMQVGEGYIKRIFKEILSVDIPSPFPRLTYTEAMNRYGSDKPDTRFEMELCDLSETVRGCGFGVFESALEGGSVRCITAKAAADTFSRKGIDKLAEFVKGMGAKGLAWIKLTHDAVNCSFSKFISEDMLNNIIEKSGAQTGDIVFIVADSDNYKVQSVLGSLRVEVAQKLGIIDREKYNLLWIVNFPFFEFDEQSGQWVAMHHPFTAPTDECLDKLESDKSSVFAKAYDLVLNGVELCSGSIRITDPALQKRMFAMLGLSDEEANEKFGFLTNAFKYGAPPHGGMGIGLDRLVMQMLRCETLRDVIAFPKTKDACEPMTECPAEVDRAQLEELGISTEPLTE